MEKVTTVMRLVTNLKHFSEMDVRNIGQASPGKEEQPGSTSGSVPPPNPTSSVGADDQKETLENAPTCILTIIGSSIGWLQVRTKHAYLTLSRKHQCLVYPAIYLVIYFACMRKQK